MNMSKGIASLCNSYYRSCQRFDMQTRRKGQLCIVLTRKPRLCAALNKGVFDSGLNSNNSYFLDFLFAPLPKQFCLVINLCYNDFLKVLEAAML